MSESILIAKIILIGSRFTNTIFFLGFPLFITGILAFFCCFSFSACCFPLFVLCSVCMCNLTLQNNHLLPVITQVRLPYLFRLLFLQVVEKQQHQHLVINTDKWHSEWPKMLCYCDRPCIFKQSKTENPGRMHLGCWGHTCPYFQWLDTLEKLNLPPQHP